MSALRIQTIKWTSTQLVASKILQQIYSMEVSNTNPGTSYVCAISRSNWFQWVKRLVFMSFCMMMLLQLAIQYISTPSEATCTWVTSNISLWCVYFYYSQRSGKLIWLEKWQTFNSYVTKLMSSQNKWIEWSRWRIYWHLYSIENQNLATCNSSSKNQV
jgi:hypothetical protein